MVVICLEKCILWRLPAFLLVLLLIPFPRTIEEKKKKKRESDTPVLDFMATSVRDRLSPVCGVCLIAHLGPSGSRGRDSQTVSLFLARAAAMYYQTVYERPSVLL